MEYGFQDAINLKSVTIPASITTIGAHAFEGCTKLQSAVFEAPTGWKSGGKKPEISYHRQGSPVTAEYDLSKPDKAAEALKGQVKIVNYTMQNGLGNTQYVYNYYYWYKYVWTRT